MMRALTFVHQRLYLMDFRIYRQAVWLPGDTTMRTSGEGSFFQLGTTVLAHLPTLQ